MTGRAARAAAAALVVLCSLLAGGCVVLVGNPLGSLGDGREPLEEVEVGGSGRDKILLIELRGPISDEPERRAFGLVEGESMLARLDAELTAAGGDDRIRAVVLAIDSPGGGVTASDEMHGRLQRWKRERGVPLVASLGDVAASGGYYVACAADRVVAHPTTVTGSIGVILMSLDLEGLLAKIGVRNQTFKAGEHKDLLSPLRAATPEERRIVQEVLDSLHARFVAVVRAARPGIDPRRLPELTDGRILDARQALEAGLVDDVADLAGAVDVARRLAGVATARVVRYRRGGEGTETIYGRLAGGPTQVNVAPIDLGALALPQARFLYLWAPGFRP